MSPVKLLTKRLQAANIPINGVADRDGVYVIDFAPEATLQHRDEAAAVLAAFDPLEPKKLSAIQQINSQAEAERLRYVTPGDGQAMTYLSKQYIELAEYDRAVAAGENPDPAKTLMMANRAALLGVSLGTVAAEWRARINAWYQVAAAIEAVREAALVAVAGAESEGEIEGILAGVGWG